MTVERQHGGEQLVQQPFRGHLVMGAGWMSEGHNDGSVLALSG